MVERKNFSFRAGDWSRHAVAAVACVIAVCGSARSAGAQTYYIWENGASNVNISGNWTTGSAWYPGYYPDSSTAGNTQGNIYLRNGGTVTVNTTLPGTGAQDVQTFYLNSNDSNGGGNVFEPGSALTVTTNGALTLVDPFYAGPSSTVNINNTSNAAAGGALSIIEASQPIMAIGQYVSGGQTFDSGSEPLFVTSLNVTAGALTLDTNAVTSNGNGGILTVGTGLDGIVNLSANAGVASSISVGDTTGSNSTGLLVLGSATSAGASGTNIPSGNTGSGTINQSSGTTMSTIYAVVGLKAPGYYNLSGGVLNVGRSAAAAFDVGPTNAGTFNMTGGTANILNMNIGNGVYSTIAAYSDTASTSTSGTVKISGGSYTGQTITLGNTTGGAGGTGTALLEVTGNGSTIALLTAGNSPVIASHQNATLQFDIGSGMPGVTAVVANATDGTNMTLNQRTNPNDVLQLAGHLNLTNVSGAPIASGSTYTLITTNVTATDTHGAGFSGIDATDAFGSGSALALAGADSGYWSFAVNPTMSNGSTIGYELDATALQNVPAPEPSCIGLLSGGSLLMLRRRRSQLAAV